MKKLIASLAAIAMLCASAPASAFAVDNPDLASLASNAGSNNYLYPQKALKYTLKQDKANIPLNLNNVNYAMCVLTVLANHGIVYPSDVKEGAFNFYDLEPCDEVNDILTKYANIMTNDKLLMEIGGTYSTTPQSKLVDEAIKNSENAGRYFLVTISNNERLYNRPTPLVGIGSAKGNWTFEKKNYDYCILTLDPSNGNKFDEERCIYINTETHDFCVPSYGQYSENCDILSVVSNDDLLNYNGPINPNTKDPFDGNDDFQFIEFMMDKDQFKYDMSIDRIKSGLIKTSGDSDNYPEGLAESFFYKSNGYFGVFVEKGATELNLDTLNDEEGKFALVTFQNSEASNIIAVTGKADIKHNDTSISITRYVGDLSGLSYDDQLEASAYLIVREVYDEPNSMPGAIMGATTGTTTVDFTAKGILFSDTDELKINIHDSLLSDDDNVIKFTSHDPVMMKYNELDKEWALFRDTGDGTFGEAIRKGDVNCDGAINSADASLVLKTYSYRSTGSETSFIDNKYGDMNGDGAIDAIDASIILKMYADASTGGSN